jgi:LuxR family maltose regulon positive regulatory protein
VRLLEGDLEDSAAYVDFARQSAGAVAAERRNYFEAHLATMTLVLGRWRGDLDTVRKAMSELDEALAGLPAGDRALSHAHRATALQNLGVAELWSSELDDAQLHLDQALVLARRTGLEWLEVSPLAHLAAASVLNGDPLIGGLRQSEEAVAFAEAHGWAEDAIIVTALATSALALVWLGRFAEAAARLERAEYVLQPGGEPGTELIVHHVRGLMALADRRLDQALSAFHAADRMQALLTGEHAMTRELRARVLQTQIAMGETKAVRAALTAIRPSDRDQPELRIATATMHVAAGEAERAVETLSPVLADDAMPLRRAWSTIEASLLDAVAREQLRDHQGAERSVERALELAEPEGIILPFLLVDVRDMLERHPRHRSSHSTLLRTILAVINGASAPTRAEAAPLLEELSDAELRVVRYLPSNLKAPEIAAELFVSTNTVRTHIRHIYAKLGAHDRDAAVARARELGLISPSLRSR